MLARRLEKAMHGIGLATRRRLQRLLVDSKRFDEWTLQFADDTAEVHAEQQTDNA